MSLLYIWSRKKKLSAIGVEFNVISISSITFDLDDKEVLRIDSSVTAVKDLNKNRTNKVNIINRPTLIASSRLHVIQKTSKFRF